MFFIIGKSGNILICADENHQPDMIELNPPNEFKPEEMHLWKYIDGNFVYTPTPIEDHQPSINDRIAKLEEQNLELIKQNNFLADCLLEMSEAVYA